MLSLDDFKKLTLDDKIIFDTHYEKYPPVHSDYLFTTMISWIDYGNYHFAKIDDNIIIMSNINGEIRFRPPSGKSSIDLSKQVLELSKKEGADDYPFGMADLQTKELVSKHFPKIVFEEHRDFFDYVYSSSDLAELPGSNYAKIRNRLNKFRKNFGYDIETISEENMDEIGSFLKRWCLWRDCESDPLLENEKKAILFSMSHFFELNLSGIIVRVKGEIEAISVFEGINPDTAVVHYEKGSPDYDGIYKLVNAETAKIIQRKYPFINRESDMGYPGLRKAKMSYHPHHMVEVFHVAKVNIKF